MTTAPFLTRPAGTAATRRAGIRAFVALAALLFALSGCGLLPDVKDETASWNADQLYKTAHGAMLEGNYTRAIKLFDALEARYPYGRYAQQAILEVAYSNYRAGETAASVAACDRFIRTYPNHPNVDYAFYLKGLVHFREDQGLLGYVYELDLSEREPKAMRESYNAFRELIAKYPDSRYAEDSTARMKYLTNALAMYEVHVATYYMNRGAYVAAVNRAQAALIGYPRTPASRDALGVLMQSYDKLGLVQLRDDTERVIRQTYPGSDVAQPSKPWWQFW